MRVGEIRLNSDIGVFNPGDSGGLVACCALFNDCRFPLDDSNPKRETSDGGHNVRSH